MTIMIAFSTISARTSPIVNAGEKGHQKPRNESNPLSPVYNILLPILRLLFTEKSEIYFLCIWFLFFLIPSD